MVQSISSGLFRIATLMILARLLLQSEMGQLAVVGIVYGFMQFLGTLGLNYASPYFVPKIDEQSESAKAKGFLFQSILVTILISSSLSIIFLFLGPLLIPSSILINDVILLLVLMGPLSALDVMLDSYLLARYFVRILSIGRIIFDMCRAGLSIGLVILGFGIPGIIMGWILAEILALVIFSVYSTRGLNSKYEFLPFGPILAFAVPSLIFQLTDVIIQNVDRIILLQITDLSALGVYDVILSLLFMMTFFSLGLATSLYPVFTRLTGRTTYEVESHETISSALSLLTRYILLALLPIAIIVSLNSSIILELLFGFSYATYPDAAISLSLLSLTYVLWGITYAYHSTLRSVGESKFFMVVGVSVIAFEILACLILTSWLGLLGTSLVRVGYVCLLFITAWARLQNRGVKHRHKLGESCVRLTIAAILSAILFRILYPTSLTSLFVISLIVGLMYLLVLFGLKEIKEIDFVIAQEVLGIRFQRLIEKISKHYTPRE